MDRRAFVAGGVALLVAPLAAEAQQPGTTTARIGYLSSQSEAGARANSEAFRQGLRDLGHVEGRNLIIEYRWAEGNNDRLPALAKELAGLNLDLIVSVGGPSAARAANATITSIPVVSSAGRPSRLASLRAWRGLAVISLVSTSWPRSWT